MKVAVFLAKGFEEIEAITIVDVLRRAELFVKTISLDEEYAVEGAHKVIVKADLKWSEFVENDFDAYVLPGGMPGTTHLGEHSALKDILLTAYESKKYIAAICAAPSVLGKIGILENKKATCYPSFEHFLEGATYVKAEQVVVDGCIITANGPASAMLFSLTLVEELCGKEKAEIIRKAMLL